MNKTKERYHSLLTYTFSLVNILLQIRIFQFKRTSVETHLWSCGRAAQRSFGAQIGLPGAGRHHLKCLNLRHGHTLLVRGGGGLLAPFVCNLYASFLDCMYSLWIQGTQRQQAAAIIIISSSSSSSVVFLRRPLPFFILPFLLLEEEEEASS